MAPLALAVCYDYPGYVLHGEASCCSLRLSEKTPPEAQETANVPARGALSPDHRLAFVSINGNGIYSNNSERNRLLAVVDLRTRQHIGEIDIDPLRIPHGLMSGAGGLLCASCDASGVVVVVDPEAGRLAGSVDA